MVDIQFNRLMKRDYNFKGKTFVVTGASSGIGRETSILLDHLGARLIMIALEPVGKVDIFDNLDRADHLYYEFDLNNISGIEALLKEIIVEVGPVDGFVHCAGIGAVRPISLTTYDFMVRVMNINFFSFIEIIRCLTRKNAFRAGFNVVGVSAVGAFIGGSTKTAYNSSKAAMNSAVRCLAKELAGKNIRINTVAPGVTETEMFYKFAEMDIDSEEYRSVTNRQYLGICKPIDIANSITFLLSDLSRMITGTCLPVDGGKLTS